MKYPWQNILYIDAMGKTIPYTAPQKSNTDASADFINLKQHPEATQTIPETKNQDQLAAALATINAPETGVFTVGCHIEEIAEHEQYKTSAYLEFAVNDQILAADAGTYFALYFQFHNRLAQTKFPHTMQFDWVILPAVFTHVDVQGFSCSIKMNSSTHSTPAQSRKAWSDALSAVTSHLANISKYDGEPIY